MKPVLQVVLFLGLVTPSFSASVNFDGKQAAPVSFTSLLKETQETNPIPAPENEVRTASKRLYEIKEDGREELVTPRLAADGKDVYEFMPNKNRYWEFKCTGQNPKPWGVCWSYTFKTETAGHNHTSADPYSYSFLNQSDGKPLPTKICKSNIPGNTAYRVYFKAPVFATLAYDRADFSGGCTGTIGDEDHVAVTAQNLIQLAELTEEPYFAFKPTSQYHPANRFGTPDTNAKMKKIAWDYYQQFNEKLTVNDMGLVWGGRYNSPPVESNTVPNCWVDGQEHFYHRYGRQIDVRSSTVNTQQKRDCLKELACRYQVEPLFEGKAPGSLLGRDLSLFSETEMDALDRVEHYHFNFARPTDPQVTPQDDTRKECSSYLPPEVSACPKPYSVK